MDLTYVVNFITNQLKQVTPETFHQWNFKDKVVYPYLTFDVHFVPNNEIRETYEVVIDTFEFGRSSKRLFELETDLKEHLDRKRFIEEEAVIQTRMTASRGITTGNDSIKRRNVRFQVKVDWKQP